MYIILIYKFAIIKVCLCIHRRVWNTFNLNIYKYICLLVMTATYIHPCVHIKHIQLIYTHKSVLYITL